MKLHQRLGRKIAVALGALSLLIVGTVAAPTPVQASHSNEFSHWGYFSWNGQPQMAARSFYLYDRATDANQKAATREFVDAYNNDINRRGLYGVLPAIAYVDDPWSAGNCGNHFWSGWSYMTICSIDKGHLGLTSTGFAGDHNQNIQPAIWNRPGQTYNTAFTTVCHEMGHALGLSHRPNFTSGTCMSGVFTLNQKIYFDEHDFQELIALYNHAN